MFCPKCSQPFIEEVRFCSRCGFPLEGVRALLASGGELPMLRESPRRRGVRHGTVLMLGGMIATPLVGMLYVMLGLPPELVGLVAVLFFIGGLMRLLYAVAFEPGPWRLGSETTSPAIASRAISPQLPGRQTDRSLTDASSVIEGTTRLLDERDARPR